MQARTHTHRDSLQTCLHTKSEKNPSNTRLWLTLITNGVVVTLVTTAVFLLQRLRYASSYLLAEKKSLGFFGRIKFRIALIPLNFKTINVPINSWKKEQKYAQQVADSS